MNDDKAPRMRLSSEHWYYQNFHLGELIIEVSYLTENCTDEDIERILPIIESRRYYAKARKLTTRTWKRFYRYPQYIKVKSVYEVNS